jgi:hypothetical protein
MGRFLASPMIEQGQTADFRHDFAVAFHRLKKATHKEKAAREGRLSISVF